MDQVSGTYALLIPDLDFSPGNRVGRGASRGMDARRVRRKGYSHDVQAQQPKGQEAAQGCRAHHLALELPLVPCARAHDGCHRRRMSVRYQGKQKACHGHN